jgi:hypothetical protein
VFPKGAAMTRFNRFERMKGVHVRFESGSIVSECSFVGLTELGGGPDSAHISRAAEHTTAYRGGGVQAEEGSNVSNCKFIRTMVHAPWPLAMLKTKDWVGNTFLWSNILGSVQSSYSVTDAQEFTLVSADMETYGACWQKPAVEVRNVQTTTLYGMHGRLECHTQPNTSVLPDTAAFELDTKSLYM